jgi:hypothetical protein
MRSSARRSASRLTLVALLSICAVGVLAFATHSQLTAVTLRTEREPYPVADHWPPFSMTYQVAEFDPRTQAVKSTAPYLVEWTDRRHWRQTLLDQSGDLVIGGVEWEQNGDQHYFTSRPGAPRWRTDRECPCSDILPTPAEFLIPEFFVAEKLRLMKHMPERPVWSDGRGHTSFWWIPRPGGSELRQITYRESDGMPLQYVVYDDGVVQRMYDVLEIKFLDDVAPSSDRDELPLPAPPPTVKKL